MMIFKKAALLNLSVVINVLALLCVSAYSQQVVPINSYSINNNGQVQLEVNSSDTKYYILKVKHHVDSAFALETSMTLGEDVTTVITEPLSAYPLENYEVIEYDIGNPNDTDGDGIDDVTEFQNMPNQNPLNFAAPVTIENGQVGVDDTSTFNFLALKKKLVSQLPFLNGKEFAKFIILEFPDNNRRIYFINTNTHALHLDFATFLGVDHLAPDVVKGQVTYHPTILSNNGTLGAYAFNYTNNEGKDFRTIQQTHELLAASMPFIENNMSYYITENNEQQYQDELELMQNSRIPVVFESDVYAGLDYWGLNQTEGYGFFRKASTDIIPGAKDIMLYESLPNSLPRVAGIMTSVIQTPLSHVNLRAIQDKIPNAFIRNPLDNDTIAGLLNEYIYYKVEQSNYTIRKASVDEVNEWFDKIRPKTELTPPLNLDYTEIKPLEDITFDMFDGFGAKCTNVATMRRFGFAEGTVPDGFGIPFYFYQEFMKHNNFFSDIKTMINNPDFINNRDVREDMLDHLRKKIRNAQMPVWMWDALADMQASFPTGTSIRTRSSTNNEDLPGFSGAGLYDSKTQHPHEGHIAKSVKQVYASLWNLRAFEEREFFRVDHFAASMGILCHPNYSNEKVNGVGISADPIYNTDNYYLNSQLEEVLITNPGDERPEEMLLSKVKVPDNEYSVIQYSSLVHDGEVLLELKHINRLRTYLTIIHDEFKALYKAEDNSTFAMDIEYKINSNNQLIIKQARPWVQYEPQEIDMPITNNCETLIFPNPANDFINVTCVDCNITTIRVVNINGQFLIQKDITNSASENAYLNIGDLPSGVYFVSVYIDSALCKTTKIVKR